jgi:transposase
MRQFTFTDKVRQTLAHERYHHPDPRVQQRMEIVWLKSQGEKHTRSAELAGVSRPTVQRVLTLYAQQGLEGLRTFQWKGQPSALTPHRQSLEQEFQERPPHTVAEACRRIEDLTGVRRRATRMRLFLRKTLGLRFRKVAAVPVPPKETVEEHARKQAAFLKGGIGAAVSGGPRR